jgi:hypothetical protein
MTNKENFLKLVSWEETDTVKRAKERIAKKQASKLTAVEWFAMVTGGWKYASKEQLEQAKEMEQQQMLKFGKAVADHWGMMPVPMSNIKDMLDETKITYWGGNHGDVDKKIALKNGTDLDMEMFAFLSWLDFNRDVETIDGLLRKDGYDWYNSQWKSWLHNSDAGKRVLNYSGTVSWWGGNPDINNTVNITESIAVEKNIPMTQSMGETTIEFPKQHKPEQYNPNRAQLDTMEFKFYQEENCVDGGEGEYLTVEAKSNLGIDGDGGSFYVLKTNQWAFSDIDELATMLKRVEAAVMATKPTSVHVK